MPPREAQRPPVVRSKVKPSSDHRTYREALRHDFWYSCAYCTLAESEAQGVGFEIDHYLPRAKRPDLAADYGNLLWSCEVCNNQKGDFMPGDILERSDCYILRPDQDDPADHYELMEDHLQHRSSTGEFNIDWLLLNRKPLRRLRRLRAKLWKAREICAFGIQRLGSVPIDRLERKQRFSLLRLRRQVADDYGALQESLDGYIRERTRSPLLDPDPEHGERLTRRRAWLDGEGALSPGSLERKARRPKGRRGAAWKPSPRR